MDSLATERRQLPAPHQVHIWWRGLGVPPRDVQAHWTLLSDDERERAKRFVFDRDRRRFVVARATLRLILSTYLGTPPGGISFEYGSYGKPRLPLNARQTPLEFSVSHAHELAVYGVGVDGPLGVDVEWLERAADVERLAQTVFSAAERVALLAMHERDRSRAFMTGWTRKEAYLKARGSGLSADPRLVEVGLGFERSRLVARDEPATEYQIESFVPHPGYVGALAAPSDRAGAPGPVLLLRPWPPAS